MIDSKISKVFRGIAILMVIGSHYAGWMYTEPFNETLRAWISTWGVYGVDVFLLLSGYGLVKSYEKNGIDRQFILKRFFNSYVPYILIVGFFAIIDKSIDSTTAVVKLLIGYDYWYMCVLFALYIMFMVFYKIGKFKEITLTVGVIAFTYFLYARGQAPFWELSNAAFLLGVYAATLERKYKESLKDLIIKVNLALTGFALMVICAFWHINAGTMSSHMAASICFTVMTLGLAVQMKAGGLILPALGRYSLYIYLLHTRLFWKFVAYKEDWSYFKGSVIAGIITLFVSIAIGFCIEWWCTRLIKKMTTQK